MGKSNVPVRHIRGEGVKDKRDGVVSIDTNTYKMYVGDGIEAHQIEAGGGGGASMIETTYAELVEKRDNAQLQAGCLYRITDYECTSSDEETQCAGHNYDIIVTALSSDTLGEECRAIQHEGDTYFNGQNLNSWKVWYTLDNGRTSWGKQGGKQAKVEFYGMEANCAVLSENDTTYEGLPIKVSGAVSGQSFVAYTKYGVTNSVFDLGGFTQEIETNTTYIGEVVGGKGVVYRLIDDKGNDVSYDFKNLMFKRYKITSEDYLFFDMCKGVKNNENYEIDEEDYKFFYTFSVGEEEGSIEDYSMSSFVYDNKLNGKGIYNNIFSNTFGSGCYSNTFGSGCYSNTFGNYCYSNTFGDNCYSNTFERNCKSNTFGSGCYSNTFGNYCHNNTFGSGCDSNTFGSDCDSNTFGNYCYSNTFGSGCDSNTFGNYCYSNTFGDECYYNTFDVTKKYNSCVVLDNVKSVSFSFVDYQSTARNSYTQYCGYNSQGVLKYWTPADLVQ